MKWIEAVAAGTSPSGKTKRFIIQTKEGEPLGIVQWYAPWRRYTYQPRNATLYEVDCLRDIAEFLTRIQSEHKEKS